MKKELLHIYGPLAINSYGVFIVVGIGLFVWLLKKHQPKSIWPARQLNLADSIIDISLIGTITGIIGGRIFFMISEPGLDGSLASYFSLWDGGFSLLGSIIAIIISLICFFRVTNIPALPSLDIIALHAPILQSIARVGCFFAGCCHGIPTQSSWGFIYTDPDSMAPLHTALHPTQLYSALILFSIFILLYYVVQPKTHKPGQLFSIYLLCVSAERFFIDFWRADRIVNPAYALPLSTHQYMALALFVGASGTLAYVSSMSNALPSSESH